MMTYLFESQLLSLPFSEKIRFGSDHNEIMQLLSENSTWSIKIDFFAKIPLKIIGSQGNTIESLALGFWASLSVGQ